MHSFGCQGFHRVSAGIWYFEKSNEEQEKIVDSEREGQEVGL